MGESLTLDVESFEKRLGLTPGFNFKLLEEDDWSFLIKISALVEAACTHTLAHKFGYPELEDSLARLDQGASKIGRISLLKKTGALYDNQAKTLTALANLRNLAAHDIKNVDFKLKEHIANHNKQQRTKFITEFGGSIDTTTTWFGKEYEKSDFVYRYPKLCIWAAVCEILACLYLEVEQPKLELPLLNFK